MAIRIRQLQPADADAVGELWKAVDLVGPEYDATSEIQAVTTRNADLCFVACVEENGAERIVGSILGIDVGWGGLASRLAVEPLQRRQGIARLLVDALESRLKALGRRGASALVWQDNAPARAFWQTMKYEEFPQLLETWHGWAEDEPGAEAVPSHDPCG